MRAQLFAIGFMLWLALPVVPAQDQTTQPTQPAVPSPAQRVQRLNDLCRVIESQVPLQTRRTVAKELLLQNWPEKSARVVAILSGSNTGARAAIALALTDTPEALAPEYVEPLLSMLGDADNAVREAAASALAAYADAGVAVQVRELAKDRSQSRMARLSAIGALARMTDREAISGLVDVLGDPDPEIVRAGLVALTEAVAIDFGDDVAVARSWWEESRSLSPEAWQHRQIERLVRKNRDLRLRLDAAQNRLIRLYEETFQRATEPERVAALTAYLGDAEVSIRLLGLRLAQLHLTEGKPLPAELRDRVRELLASPDAVTQAAAIRTLASLRDPEDAERFLKMLPAASAREVRLALINGLGHVGTSDALDALLPLLDSGGGSEEAERVEAVSAIGRLAERGLLKDGGGERAAEALQREWNRAQPLQVALRERLLRAMSSLADRRFAPAFAAGLERHEPVSIRQAAVRGLVSLKDSASADALLGALGDPDAGVRKSAVEAFAALAQPGNAAHVLALWDRVISTQETDDTVRQIARRAFVELLSRAPTEVVESWLSKLPRNGPDAQRTLELLQRLIRAASENEPVDRYRLGLLRAAVAGYYVQLQQVSEALLAYSEAVSDLHTGRGAEAARPVALELVRYALVHRRYDGAMAAALSTYFGQEDVAALWEAAASVVEPRLTPETVDQAAGMVAALESSPPGAWPEGAQATFQRWREVIERIRQGRAGATAPATRPTQASLATSALAQAAAE